MQKILIFILAIFSSGLVFFFQNENIFAACSNDISSKDYCNEADKASDAASAQATTTSSTTSGPMTIYTSEMVPGAKCQCVTGGGTAESL